MLLLHTVLVVILVSWTQAESVETAQGNVPTIDDAKQPLILVPGFTASSIEYKLTKKRSSFPDCPTDTDDWEVLWLDTSLLANQTKAVCFVEDMEVQVMNNRLQNFPGVATRPRDFGGVEGMEYQDLNRKVPAYYKIVIDSLRAAGWVVGETMFGAPYDWRFGGVRVDTYFTDLKNLVENAFNINNKRVNIYAHSMGPSVVLYFLNQQTQAWKDKYIRSFICVVPVWSGNVVSVWNAIGGLDCKAAWGADCPGAEGALGKFFLREVGTNLPGMYWTFPLPGKGADDGSWDRNEVIIKTPSKEYTAYDMTKLLTDLGFERQSNMQKIVAGSLTNFLSNPPMVDTYVYYGSEVKTPSKFVYDKDFKPTFPGQPLPEQKTIEYNTTDDGDGVVPLRSALRSNLTWPALHERAGKVLEHKAYRGMQHLDTKGTIADLIKLLDSFDGNDK